VLRCLLYSPLAANSQATKPTDAELSAVFQKDLLVNVFRDGVFGSFRHILLPSGCLLVCFISRGRTYNQPHYHRWRSLHANWPLA